MEDKLTKVRIVKEYLEELKIKVETIKHDEVVSCDESKNWYDMCGYKEEDYGLCKNLLIRDKKGHSFWLVIVDYEKQVDLGILKDLLQHSKKLGLATPMDLEKHLDEKPGSVSIFSILSDQEDKVKVIIDKDLLKKPKLAFHPRYNGMTSFISGKDTLKFLDELNREYSILDIPVKDYKVLEKKHISY